MALALVLAIGMHSGYVSAITMECFSSGNTKVFVGEVDACCAIDNEGVETLSARCCSFTKSDASLNLIKLQEEAGFQFFAVKVWVEPLQIYFFPELTKVKYTYFSHAPPLSGRDILIFISKFTL